MLATVYFAEPTHSEYIVFLVVACQSEELIARLDRTDPYSLFPNYKTTV